MVKMKTKKNMRAIALFGLLVVVMSFGIQTASAGPLGGGDSFENATQIYSGYTAEAWLDVGDVYYFYIMVNPGQTLVVKGSIVAELGSSSVTNSIYDKDKMALRTLNVFGDSAFGTMLWTLNSDEDSYKLYIRVYGVWLPGGVDKFPYVLNVSVEDHYDANRGTDAGDTFDIAMNITQGSYEGFLSGNYDYIHLPLIKED
jgi:hypothetical protein